MKKFQALFALVITLLFPPVVEKMQAAPAVGIPYGSRQAVEQYSLAQGNGFHIGIFQKQDSGTVEVGNFVANINFTTKNALDTYFRSNFISMAQKAIDGNVGQNRDQPFRMEATYSRLINGKGVPYTQVFYFVADVTFSLVKNGSTYSLPADLTTASMELPSDYVAYRLPKYLWAMVETVASNGYPIRTMDSQSNPQDGFDLPRSLIFIPTQYAVSGDYKITVRMVDSLNAFLVFDENGNIRPEKPIGVQVAGIKTLAANADSRVLPGQAMSLQVSAELGRVIKIQSSEKLGAPWTDVPGGMVINLPAYFTTVDVPIIDGGFGLYRAVAVDGAPIPK